MRHLKNRKKSIKTESSNEKIFKNIENKSKNFRNLKIILLLSWILLFIAVFIIHLSKLKLPEKTKKIVCKILNMNFSVILTQFVLVSILQPLSYARVPGIIIYIFLAAISGLSVYWIVSHIIGTVKFLNNKDYSYKFSANIMKSW